MKENAQKKIANLLMDLNSNILFENKRQKQYLQFKNEVISNVNEIGNYPESYIYVSDLRLFFTDIYNGFLNKRVIQLSINFFEEDKTKKLNIKKL